jgi:DNA-binding transcriptional ArsR family regulator
MTVNEAFEPTEECERVLDVFKAGRESPGPWGRANPRYVIDETGVDKPNVEYHLRRLRDAGWIRRVSRGLYEFECDPRDG